MSEYPAGTDARRYHFGRRNSLIAALSVAVLVVRATARSGTLLTAAAARRLKRPLFVVPGSPVDPLAKGCLELIDDGAKLATNPERLVAELKTLVGEVRCTNTSAPRRAHLLNLSPDAARVYRLLQEQGGCMHPDEIAARVRMPSCDVLVELLELELSGLVEVRPRGYMARSGRLV